MRSLQEEFNLSSGDFVLSPGEYQGPLVVKRPCAIDGSHATLWADRGPVLVIEAPGVTVRNLRVEVTGPLCAGAAGAAIQANRPGTRLEDVEAAGAVLGVSGEAEDWRLPTAIPLGEFAPDHENAFAFALEAAGPAELSCRLRDVVVTPQRLVPGKNRVTVQAGPMRDNTILFGELVVHTAVARRIYLTGKCRQGAPVRRAESLLPVEQPFSGPASPPLEAIPPAAPDGQVAYITRGQRVAAEELREGVIKVAYEHQYAGPSIDLDVYVFLLQANGKVRGDQDLVFFSNQASPDGGVRLASAGGRPLVLAELARLDPAVGRVAVCYSIYGDRPRENFSQVAGPLVRVFHGDRELYRFPLEGLTMEKTVVALELYRYKGQWKMNFVGSGYHSGLKALCESYGLEVE